MNAITLSLIARVLQCVGTAIGNTIHDLAESVLRFGESIDETVASAVIGIEESGDQMCAHCMNACQARICAVCRSQAPASELAALTVEDLA